MCMSVYFARSALMPTTSGRRSASSTSAWPNGAGRVRCPSPAIEAIIAEAFGGGVFSTGDPRQVLDIQQFDRVLPLLGSYVHKVVLLARLEERHATSHLGVEQD